jgi:hypothetical protein
LGLVGGREKTAASSDDSFLTVLNRPIILRRTLAALDQLRNVFLFVRHWFVQEGEDLSPARTWRSDQRQAFTPAVILFIAGPCPAADAPVQMPIGVHPDAEESGTVQSGLS